MQSMPRPARYAAAALALAAGLIYLGVAPEHSEDAFEYGRFMLVIGLAQIAAALLFLVHLSRALLVATIAGSVAVLAVFWEAYTTGVPFGPHAGDPEELRPAIVISKAIELGLLLALIPLVHALPARAGLGT